MTRLFWNKQHLPGGEYRFRVQAVGLLNSAHGCPVTFGNCGERVTGLYVVISLFQGGVGLEDTVDGNMP